MTQDVRKRTRRRRRRRLRTLQPLIMLALVLLVGIGIVLGIRGLWRNSQPRFVDVMIELGQPMPAATEFTTKYADPDKVEMITPADSVPIDQVGVYPVVLRDGKHEATVTLTVRDTTKPVVIAKNVAVAPGTTVEPEAFLAEVQDLSETTAFFLDKPQVLNTFGSVQVVVYVEDTSGNETIVECVLDYTWLKSEYQMEMGHVLTKSDLFLVPDVDPAVLDQAALDHITWFGVGFYEVGCDWNNESRLCAITVVDTTAPDLQLKELSIFADQKVSAEDFVESLTDASRTAEVRLLNELVFGQVGLQQTVRIEARDASGNTTVKETTLQIVEDKAPVFSGLDDIVIDTTKTPDYRRGVAAMDDRDGAVQFQIDSSQVQLGKPGTYFVTYTAVDSAGHKTEAIRRVVIT